MTSVPIIQTDKVIKEYGMGNVRVSALNGVTLTIGENEFVAIMGPSGSGKSTLLNILGCLDRPTSGEYYLAGEDVSNMNKVQLAIVRNRKIGFVFQSYNLLTRTTAVDNVLLPLIYQHDDTMNEEEQYQRALKALDSVGLSDRVMHQPHELSGGQKQRVAIARALINNPVLILADEPTGNLDSKSGQEIMALLSELHKQGRTIVMVTHDDAIATFAQRIIRLFDGKIAIDQLNGQHQPAGAIQGGEDAN
ncbi:macrolide ABC transporter ATP-binding protein [candidate division KSB1 bacterium 4484_219]|nr:MAG: macrolide ABC transporter ATP-binding protein [candidate division KSB1 bacterium 4484_219]HEY61539.1 ABC transporter ATP-binding protein [Anaerolineae bacterium]